MSEKDLALHRGLMKLLEEATFQLKAREVAAFAQVYSWAKDLPTMLEKKPVEKTVKKKK